MKSLDNLLLTDEKATNRIKSEQIRSKIKLFAITGESATKFDELAKIAFPNIDFTEQIKSFKKIISKAKI